MAPPRRPRLAGRALTALAVVVSVLGCIVCVPRLGLIPVVAGLLTILAGIHAGQRSPSHAAVWTGGVLPVS